MFKVHKSQSLHIESPSLDSRNRFSEYYIKKVCTYLKYYDKFIFMKYLIILTSVYKLFFENLSIYNYNK